MSIVITISYQIALAILITYVLARSSEPIKARIFAFVVIIFGLLNTQFLYPYMFTTPSQLYTALSVFSFGLGLLCLASLWLLSSIFMPQWLQGKYPLVWISIPYVIVLVVLAIDLTGRFGFVFNGIDLETQRRLQTEEPGATFLTILLVVGWLVQIIMLLTAVIRRAELRRSGLLLIGSLIVTVIYTRLNQALVRLPVEFTGMVTSIPLLLSLAYMVLRTSLFGTTQTALDMALRSVGDIVLVLDSQHTIVYLNEQAAQLGFRIEEQFDQQVNGMNQQTPQSAAIIAALNQAEQADLPLLVNQRRIMLTISAVQRGIGKRQGTLLLGRDITDIYARTEQLEQHAMEQQQLLALVASLEVPLIPLDQGIIVAPIIGHLNMQRAHMFTRRLLEAVHARRTHMIILDLTSVPEIDAGVGRVLLQTTNSLRLLGCSVVVSGISPQAAAALINQDIRLDGIQTVRSPQEALRLNPTRHMTVVQ